MDGTLFLPGYTLGILAAGAMSALQGLELWPLRLYCWF